MRGRQAVKVLGFPMLEERHPMHTLRRAYLAQRRRRGVLRRSAKKVIARIMRDLRAQPASADDSFQKECRFRWIDLPKIEEDRNMKITTRVDPDSPDSPIVMEFNGRHKMTDADVAARVTPALRELGFAHTTKITYSETLDGATSSIYRVEVFVAAGHG